MAMMVSAAVAGTQVLGITVVTGDAWRDEEVQHTLRMLELIGRTDVPVVPGAVFPLVRTQKGNSTGDSAGGQGDVARRVGAGSSNLDLQAASTADFRAAMILISCLRFPRAHRTRCRSIRMPPTS